MTYSLPELETRLGRLLKGDVEDLIAALPVAGWLSACGRPCSDQLLSTIKGKDFDPTILLLGRISEAEADLEQTEGIDLGLTLAQVQGLIQISANWNLATEAAHRLAYQANEVSLDDQAAEWLEQWRDDVPLDPLDDLTIASVAFPVSFNQILLADALTPNTVHEVKLIPTDQDPLHRWKVEELLVGAAFADQAPEEIRRKIDTEMMPLEIGNGQSDNISISIQRTLTKKWVLMLEIESEVPVQSVRFGPIPFEQTDKTTWNAFLVLPQHRQWLEPGGKKIIIQLVDQTIIHVE